MKRIILAILAGMLFFGFGCPLDGNELDGDNGAVVELPPEENGTVEENETGIIDVDENATECFDGTPVGNCSIAKPKICDVYGNLVEDAETCGCPENSLKRGAECIYNCKDETPIGSCSTDQPLYCNMTAELEDMASLCGCAPGYDVDGENCRNACDDGTPKFACSTETPPYYCNDDYKLVMNPLLCGCNVWEFLVGASCYDPTAETYASGEAIRITEYVTMQIGTGEELSCNEGGFLKFRLTVSNTGNEEFEIEEKNFKIYNDGARVFQQRPTGCNTAGIFKWGTIPAGESRTGQVWFRLIGGTGVFTGEYSHQFSPIVIKDFEIERIDMEG